MPCRPLFSAAARPYVPAEAGHVASDVRRRALAAPSVLARRPPPPEHHCPPRARCAKFLQIAWWNHGKTCVLPVAVAWKVVLRNRPATRKRLHIHGLEEEIKRLKALGAPIARWPILPPRPALRKRRDGFRWERFLNFGQLWRPREPKELIELSILAGFQSSGTFRSIRMILFHDQNVSVRG